MKERVEPAPVEVGDGDYLYVRVRPPESRGAVCLAEYPGEVTGERVVVQQPRGWIFDLRAVGEPRVDGDRVVVPVSEESEWYLAQAEGRLALFTMVNVRSVFVERPRPA